MRRRRYPLDPLRSLRDAGVRARTQELGRVIQSREQAEHGHTAAQVARKERQEAVRGEQLSEHERLERGVLRAADLEAQAHWSREQQQAVAGLRERERHAAQQLRDERQHEGRAREVLAQAEQAARVVEEHRGVWQKAERTRLEKAEEDEALDIHAARAQGAKSRGAS